MDGGPVSNISCQPGTVVVSCLCTSNDRQDAIGLYQCHFNGCKYCCLKNQQKTLTHKRMGVKRGVIYGGEMGGQVNSSLSIVFARVSILHSRYTSFVCLSILLTDRGWRPWAYRDKIKVRFDFGVVCFYPRLNRTPLLSYYHYEGK